MKKQSISHAMTKRFRYGLFSCGRHHTHDVKWMKKIIMHELYHYFSQRYSEFILMKSNQSLKHITDPHHRYSMMSVLLAIETVRKRSWKEYFRWRVGTSSFNCKCFSFDRSGRGRLLALAIVATTLAASSNLPCWISHRGLSGSQLEQMNEYAVNPRYTM